MTADEIKGLLDRMVAQAKAIAETAKTALKNNKSLGGSNFYGNKFHDQCVALTAIETQLRPAFERMPGGSHIEQLQTALAKLKSTGGSSKSYAEALKAIQSSVGAHILPAVEAQTASPVPVTEQVLPKELVKGTRGYIEAVVDQANGSYEHRWFDACSVMIRRLVETLIIEVYEADKRLDYIKDNDGSLLMLNGLISKIMGDGTYHLGRETKEGLPLMKTLGDRSAHHRQYIAKKPDVDKLIHPLRVIVEELLHLAKLHK